MDAFHGRPESRTCDLKAYSKNESMPAPMPVLAPKPGLSPIHSALSASMPAPMRSIGDRLFHTAQNACFASSSYRGFDVRRLSVLNSSTREPAPAAHVSV